MNRRFPFTYLLVVLASLLVLFGVVGCGEPTPTSPNEKTAAPARMPGVDPKAPPIPGPNGGK